MDFVTCKMYDLARKARHLSVTKDNEEIQRSFLAFYEEYHALTKFTKSSVRPLPRNDRS